MSTTQVLEKRSPQEKKAILVELLREMIQQTGQQTFSIDDEAGKSIGLFSPSGIHLHDDVFVEGTPEFFAELERRRKKNDLISADEALTQLRAMRATPNKS
jgi:hypothetical protein